MQTILLDGQVAGNIGSWPQDGVRLVGYWIGNEQWGKDDPLEYLASNGTAISEGEARDP